MPATYQEPVVSFLVLDFQKPAESRLCLESIERHALFPHKTIYLHNGESDYACQLFKDGLIDQFIQTRTNNGLGIGTRDLFAASFSRYSILFQNDQILAQDFTHQMLDQLIALLWLQNEAKTSTIASVSLAGQVAGPGIYSERGHLIETSFYKAMELVDQRLGYAGAGPYNDSGDWREAQIQSYYKERGFVHFTQLPPMVQDNGVWTIRDLAGGRMRMRTDTKALTWLKPPIERAVFPDHTDEEWTLAIAGQWPAGQTPANYTAKGQVFNCWGDAT